MGDGLFGPSPVIGGGGMDLFSLNPPSQLPYVAPKEVSQNTVKYKVVINNNEDNYHTLLIEVGFYMYAHLVMHICDYGVWKQ